MTRTYVTTTEIPWKGSHFLSALLGGPTIFRMARKVLKDYLFPKMMI